MLLDYRKDIDGLRAIAVLLVVLFHMGLPINGGFIGVDIFFVISGFLIASLIQKQILRGKFTFSGFYVHRIRRILPAMLFVMSVTLAFSWFLLMPSFYIASIESFLYSILQGSNFHYFSGANDYFATDTSQMQFLHSWSLSVESQFYILIPFILLALFKYTYNTKFFNILLIFTTLLFIFISQYMVTHSDYAAYYLLPARVFELLMGVVLALNYSKLKTIHNIYYANVLGFIALLLIFLPAFILSADSRFPGLNAFLPCLGAVLIIYLGKSERKTLVSKVLSLGPVVWVGLISYSLYLWHWPIIATINILKIELCNYQLFILFALMIALSFLTWKFVEQPFRYKFKWSIAKTILLLILLPVFIAMTFKVLADNTNGFVEYRFSKEIQKLIPSAEVRAIDIDHLCMEAVRENRDYSPEKCFIGDLSNTKPDVLLYGDSHANSIGGFLGVLLEDAKLRGLPLTNFSYLYLKDKNTREKPKYDGVIEERAKIRKVLNHTISTGNFKYVVMSGYYKGAVILYGDKNPDLGLKTLYEGLKNNIEFILSTGAVPVIIKDVPFIEKNDHLCLIFNKYNNDKSKCFKPSSEVKEEHKKYEEIFVKLEAEYPMLITIDPKKVMCDKEKCYKVKEGTSFYFDEHHLSYDGSKYLGQLYLKEYGNPFKNI
jgi:peptidoglycan/LPS O-acetylase OafA/YrhL